MGRNYEQEMAWTTATLGEMQANQARCASETAGFSELIRIIAAFE